MQISFRFFLSSVSSHKNALLNVTSGSFRGQNGHEDEVFRKEDVLHFLLECLEHHKYANYTNMPIMCM